MATVALAVGLLLLLVLPAQALPLSFDNITRNSVADATIGEHQLFLDVAPAEKNGLTGVGFTFSNIGPAASSITDVYFDDGALLALMTITNSTGVEFAQGASPKNLPGRNSIFPVFDVSPGLSADSTSPTQPNGVNPGESLSLFFTLQNGRSFADVRDALATGALRVGIHVQGFAGGGSESFVNHRVPEPATLYLLGAGLLGLATWLGRRVSDE
jgi:hypothetical protein